jgi:DNA-binding Lrp family transcriptional regulator
VTTIKDFAREKKISPKAARSRLDRMVERGLMVKRRGLRAEFVYQAVQPVEVRWHDPFNLIERRAT